VFFGFFFLKKNINEVPDSIQKQVERRDFPPSHYSLEPIGNIEHIVQYNFREIDAGFSHFGRGVSQ